MQTLKKFLSGLFTSGKPPGRDLRLEVRCSRCGEIISLRVDLANELSLQDETGTSAGYYCRKVVIGQQRCYQPIEIELFFDVNRRLKEKKIQGGQFVDTH
jgi:hypothetical protein